MDALPLLLNQLDLMQKLVSDALTNIQHQHESGQFDGNEQQKEHNLLTYSTNEYQEAHDRIQSIAQELQSQLKSWSSAPDDAKPVQISLDSYQLNVLRMQLEHHLKDGNDSNDKRSLLEETHLTDRFTYIYCTNNLHRFTPLYNYIGCAINQKQNSIR